MTSDFMKQTALKLKMTIFLDDVRGIQLINVMNNIRISNMTPREVIDEKDDKDQVVLPIFMPKNDQPSTSGSHDQNQSQLVQDQQMASSI